MNLIIYNQSVQANELVQSLYIELKLEDTLMIFLGRWNKNVNAKWLESTTKGDYVVYMVGKYNKRWCT